MYKIRVYKKDLDYSYCLGVFPVVELLQKMPKVVDQVLLSSEGSQNGGVDEIMQLCEKNQIPYSINDHKIKLLAPKENTYAIAVFDKYQMQINPEQKHVVLVEPRNMGNLGTIIRTMVAFGFYDLAIIRPAADIFDPKVISSTMGALFQVRIQYYNSLADYAEKFEMVGSEKRELYTFTIDEAKDFRKVELTDKTNYSLVFGNEGAGLSDADAALGSRVMIPQVGDVDSLNLSIAVGVALWETVRG
jgi:TrmH family RNA methyltransferase